MRINLSLTVIGGTATSDPKPTLAIKRACCIAARKTGPSLRPQNCWANGSRDRGTKPAFAAMKLVAVLVGEILFGSDLRLADLCRMPHVLDNHVVVETFSPALTTIATGLHATEWGFGHGGFQCVD